MKVIAISTDRKIFEEGSAVRGRMIEYGRLFERLDIIIFSKKSSPDSAKATPGKQQSVASIKLSENVFVYPTNSKNRLFYIFDALKIAHRLTTNYKLLTTNLVISSQDPFETGLVGLLLKLRYKLPLQIQLHTDFTNKYFITHSLLNLVRFPLGLFVLSFADSVRVVSRRIEKSIHTLAHNVSVLPIFVNSSQQIVVSSKGKTEKISFLTVARLEKEKDLKTALEAFAIASINSEFVIVGDGSEKRNLENLCRKLKIENKVKFVGWQNDLAEFYQNADVYISTSLYEGYGMSIVEAGSYGLPLILSDAGIAGDFLKDKEEALICKQKDTTSFASAMKELASNLDLRREMGEKARLRAEKNEISLDEYLTKYKNSIQQALVFFEANHSLFKTNILLRYFIAGITAASTNIGLLYIFTEIFNIWYLYSSVLSFIISIVVSFVLQKFWTFGDRETSKIHHQALRYLGVAVLGLGFNTLSMFFLVDILYIWYILAQVITGGLIMVFNFLMYKFFIFNQR